LIIDLIVPRKILPERVFGNSLATIMPSTEQKAPTLVLMD
jgi:hypothetical protein